MENNANGFRFPGEFEEQEAVWFSWPGPADEAKRGLSPIPVVVELIKTLVSHVKVKIGAQNEEEKSGIESMLKSAGVSLKNVSISIIPHNSLWVRDFGPIYLKNDEGDKILRRFGFNGWGQSTLDSPGVYLDQRFPDHVAKIEDLPLDETKTISEGGDREFNGKGAMIAVE
ncbi:MAG: agmatine deiminase family protein, partial [Anaerolineales bacterium]